MNKTVTVHVKTLVNKAKIRREKLNGRDVIIVPSVTMPDGIVMNDILYPGDEIEKGYATLNRTPAPLGHPQVNGVFVSANDPEGLALSYIGAFNANVVRKDGRVYLDKIIDVERAEQSAGGKRVLAAIEAGEPIHTSTGLLTDLEAANGDVAHKFIARNLVFDHDAILLDQAGAATPEQGVGMMVNAQGDRIEVINSSTEMLDQEVDWALDSLARALDRQRRAPLLERFKQTVLDAFKSLLPEPVVNESEEENEMADVTKEEFAALNTKVDGLAANMDKIGETVSNAVAAALKPVTDNLAEMQANAAKTEKAERDTLVAALVANHVFTDAAEAEGTPIVALRALNTRLAKPGKAAALNGAPLPVVNGDAAKGGFQLPKGSK